MSVCFVCNQHKTILYRALAKQLESTGEGVLWISPSRRWADYLIADGVNPSTILCMADLHDEWRYGPPLETEDEARLADIENTGVATFANVIQMDRLLRNRPKNVALAYIAVLVREIDRFIEAHDVEVVFGEGTWAIEMVTAQICKYRGRPYLFPSTTRIPSTRFSFFEGIYQESVFEITQPTEVHKKDAAEILSQLHGGELRPHYLKLNLGQPWFRQHWWHEAALAFGPNRSNHGDETLPSLLRRSIWRLKCILHKHAVGMHSPFQPTPSPSHKPFVLLLLHMQPEASIDVAGQPFDNQVETARALARLMPVHYDLYVKEHAVAIGTRPSGFYEALRSIPNVRLISPIAPTIQLIMETRLTLTPTGTAAFEAGMLGRPAATFSKMYFGNVLVANGLDPYSVSSTDFARYLNTPSVPNVTERVNFLAWLLAQSFEGRFAAPIHDSEALSDKNLLSVTRGFISLLTALRHTKHKSSTITNPIG